MAKLTAKARKALPKKDFGLPAIKGKEGENKAGKGAYPMPDRSHAANAKARAAQQVKAGNLSKEEEKKIDRKANVKLYGSAKAPKGRK